MIDASTSSLWHSPVRVFLPVLCLLAGCAVPQPRPASVPAGTPPPVEVPRHPQLQAAEEALNAGDLTGAMAQIAAIPDRSLPAEALPQLHLLEARIAAARGQPEEVLRRLPLSSLDPQVAVAAEGLRANALQTLGDPIGAVRAWVERDRWLSEPDEHHDNQRQLWEGLSTAPLGPAERERADRLGEPVRGWVQLALQFRERDPAQALQTWLRNHPQHPARPLAEQLRRDPASWPTRTAAIGFGRWAVLLPLSGSLASTGAALRDGWVSAYLAAGAQAPVDFFDTRGTVEGALEAYRQAQATGARLIVGPLRREAVTAVVRSGLLMAPLIALNQAEELSDPQLYQMSLAPEDEARAAAEHAAGLGHRQAIALLPDNDWGRRVGAAFRERLVALGGELVEVEYYAAQTADFSPQIKRMLKLGDSEARYRQLITALGTRPVFEPRRRGDIDFVFFAGRPLEGRQIWSQFRFHRAQDLPAYATALIYDERRAPGADLAGTRFCDMPWMLSPNEGAQPQPLYAATEALNSRREQPRLFALGADAFAVAAQVARGQTQVGAGIAGLTGELWFGSAGMIQRRLDCARFTTTGVVVLPRQAEAGRLVFDEGDETW